MANDYYTHRRYLLLNQINHLGPISRTGLIELTDARPASISDMIKDLMDEKLIAEGGYASRGPGRKRLLIDINRAYICAIGIYIHGSRIVLLLSQFDGTVLKRLDFEEPFDALSVRKICSLIAEKTKELLAEFADRHVVGIGLCERAYDPALYAKGSSLLSSYGHFNDWIHSDLRPILEAATGIPVSTYSAVTLPVLALKRFGVAKDSDNFISIELSNGIGSSLYLGGTLISGAHGVAGEIGHTIIDYKDETTCYCSKHGCVESATAFPYLARRIEEDLANGVFSVLRTYHDSKAPITVADIRRAIDAGDQMCMYHVRTVAEKLGIAISNAVTLLNPDLVILHGFMTELGPYFTDQIERSLRENTLVLSQNFRVVVSGTMDDIMPLGATAEVFSQFLRMEEYKWVYTLYSEHPEEEA